MKTVSVVILVFALGVSLASNHHAQARSIHSDPTPSSRFQKGSEGILFLLRLEKELYSSNQPTPLQLSIKNAGKKALFLSDTYPERDYKFTVKNDNGEAVPLTKEGDKLVNNTAIYRSVRLKLSPGEEVHHRVMINKLYDMSAPGLYSVAVKRKAFWQKSRDLIEVTSNTVTVKILR